MYRSIPHSRQLRRSRLRADSALWLEHNARLGSGSESKRGTMKRYIISLVRCEERADQTSGMYNWRTSFQGCSRAAPSHNPAECSLAEESRQNELKVHSL